MSAASRASAAPAGRSQSEARLFREAERLRARGAHEDAIGRYRELLGLAPRHVAGLRGLAAALRALGRTRQAARSERKAAEKEAEDLCLVAEAALKNGRNAAAVKAYKRALKVDPENLEAVWGLAETAHAMEDDVEARHWVRRFLEIDPGNPEAEHWLVALGEGAVPPRADDEYVVSLFDRFADTFDHNLVEELRYAGPALLHEAVEGIAGADAQFANVLDLGCGTGLSGEPFRGWADRLDGVDLSPKMVARARRRGIYDALHVAEVTRHLGRVRRRYDLVVAADLLVYFGDLNDLFARVADVLRPGGLFAAATEWRRGPGYALMRSGRYAHGRAHVRDAAAAAGFAERSARNAVLRYEYGEPETGTVWVFGLDRSGPPA